MSDTVGSRIAAAVRAATEAGLEFGESRQRDVVHYVLERDHWRVAIDVEPDRMIGMAVEARRPPEHTVSFQFDNDLYDIGGEKHRSFGVRLEADVVAFLDQLVRRSVLVGDHAGRLTMVIPLAEDVAVVTRRRFWTTTVTLTAEPMPFRDDELVPIQDWNG
jgi:hypothetical protein